MTIALVPPATACPVPAHGGLYLKPNRATVYVTPWHAWWMAKLWHGRLTRLDRDWRAVVSRAEIERDYIAWARDHSDVALYTVGIEHALYWPTGLSHDDWQQPTVRLGDLDHLRDRWDEHLFPVRWPSAAPAPAARRTTPRRPLAPAFALPIAA